MRVVLVGQANGERRIRWRAAVSIALLLGVFCAAVASGAYFAMSGAFSPVAAAIGFMGPIIMVSWGVARALQLPINQLTPLDRAST